MTPYDQVGMICRPALRSTFNIQRSATAQYRTRANPLFAMSVPGIGKRFAKLQNVNGISGDVAAADRSHEQVTSR
jgi:hypothetical protein